VQSLYGVLALSPAVRPWWDVVELRGGRDWTGQIAAGITSSAYVVLVVSRDAVASRHVRWEWQYAREHRIPVVVVRVDAAPVPPELAGCPVYDLRHRPGPDAERLRDDLGSGRVSGGGTRSPWPFPAAVALVLAGHLVLLGWLAYFVAAVRTATAGRPYAVRSPWIGTFAVHTTTAATVCLVVACVVAAAFQVDAVRRVVRRRVRPLGALVGLGATGVTVAVGELFLLGADLAVRDPATTPRTLLWQHLLVLDGLLAVALGTAWAVRRHPALRIRTAVEYVGRPDADADDEPDDLSAVHRDAEATWLGRVLPEPVAGGAGTVAVAHEAGDEGLAGSLRMLCARLGLTVVDAAPEHLVVLVTPRTDVDRHARDAAGRGAQVVFVLVESTSLSVDADPLRRAHWVDLRRQDVASFREVARALHPRVLPSAAVPAPVAPARFLASLLVTWVFGLLVGQVVLALQILVVRLAVPPHPPFWQGLSIAAAVTYVLVSVALAVALAAHAGRPRTLRRGTVVALAVAAVVDATLLRSTGPAVLVVAVVVVLAVMQLFALSGCLAVAGSTWMSRPASRIGLTSAVRAGWPSAAAGLLLLLAMTSLLVQIGPVA